MERVMGIEPTLSAWKAEVLPLNYTRIVEEPDPDIVQVFQLGSLPPHRVFLYTYYNTTIQSIFNQNSA
jgi:hypothetical protein